MNRHVARPDRRGRRPLSPIVSGADTPLPQFVDIARQAGVAFHHTNGASAEKHLVETMGSGAVFFDYDGDGWIDIFLVDGGSIADAGRRPARASSAVPQPRQRHVRRRHGSLRDSASRVRHGRVRGRLRRRRPAGPVHHQLRTERALPQSTATAPSPTSPPPRASAIRDGARAAHSPIWIATEISICGS